jgi:tetratricopeptide (TPR) repeat protein
MESLSMKKTIVLYSLAAISCATSNAPVKSTTANMDVIEPAATRQAAPAPTDPARKSASSDAVYNWQEFFKGAPTSKERPALQQSIRQLANADKATDLMKRGRNEFSVGLYGAAESSFRQVVRKEPGNIDALIELAATLQKSRKLSKAFDVLAEARNKLAAQERPESGVIFRYRYTLAMTYLANDEKQKAHAILSDLIGKDKTFLPGYAAMAFSYLRDGKDAIAKFILEQAMDRGGDHPSLYNISGILAERQGNTVQARDFYNKALAMNDSFAPALVNRANLHMASRELQMAEADYKKALESDPASIDAMIGLGATLRQSGRYAASKDLFERVLDMDSDNPQARYNLAILLRENLKDEGSALRYFSEVTQSERANPALKASAKAAIDEIRSL